MSKGLEALERLKMFPIYQEIKRIPQQFRDKESINTDLSIIEKELKEYQHHEEILNDYGLTLANFREACLLLAMLKHEKRNIRDIDKQLKALEIIKEKGVNVGYFIFRLVHNDLSYEEYIEEQETPYLDIYVSRKKLTKKEYNLLKEVLL